MNETYQMREPCRKCGGTAGVIRPASGQNCVYCASCNTWCYNAPKIETGERQRSVISVHENMSPSKRARILVRANKHCELCGASDGILVAGHILSVENGLKLGLTERELNDDENLAAMCEACNSGLGRMTLPLRLMLAILRARVGVLVSTNGNGVQV